MADSLVSIIIPCYNATAYVGDAVQSALNQSYASCEVIVINDGSTDDLTEALSPFEHDIHVVEQENQGGGAARNRGLEHASGEYIQFLDADDLLFPSKIERQVSVMQQSGADLVYCDGAIASMETGEDIGAYARSDACEDPVMFVLADGLPITAPLHKSVCLKRVGGFREDLPCSQERDLHLRLAAEGLVFAHLPELLYRVRKRPTSISSGYRRVLDQHAQILWPVYRKLEAEGHLSDRRARAFSARLAKDARHYLQLGHVQPAEDYFEQAKHMHASGGLLDAYSLSTRMLRKFIGAKKTERFAQIKRSVRL